MLMGLACLAGTVFADAENIFGGFAYMCAIETVKICSSQAELDANQIFLCASCYDDNIKALNMAVSSKLDLNHCLTNFKGQLGWRNDGNFAKVGCYTCSIPSALSSECEVKLQCDCEAASTGVVIPIETSLINLNEGIHVHNGQLVCYEHEGTQVSAASPLAPPATAPKPQNPYMNNPARNAGANRHTDNRVAVLATGNSYPDNPARNNTHTY